MHRIVTMKLEYILLCAAVILLTSCGGTSLVSKKIHDYRFDDRSGSITILSFDPQHFTASTRYSTGAQTLAEWQQESDAIIINGAYFHEDLSPSGYVVSNGKREGNRLFDESRTSLLAVENGEIVLKDTTHTPIQRGQYSDAFQSYPLLIDNGQAAITEDSGLLARRTAIGFDTEGTTYIIFAPRSNISLYELMRSLLETGINWTDVLNLDGGPSSGVIVDVDGLSYKRDSLWRVPHVVVFTEKERETN